MAEKTKVAVAEANEEVTEEVTEKITEEVSDEAGKCAILFELENLAVGGREIRYKAIEKVLSKSVKLSPVLYSRYGVDASLPQFLAKLMAQAGKKKGSEEKLVGDVGKAVASAFGSSTAKPAAAVRDLVKQATDMGLIVGAVSVSGAASEKLAAKVGISDKENIYACDNVGDCVTADSWLKLAKQVSVQPAACAVVATSAMSCKAALSAGMWCLAIPDKYTSFQDFSGVDHVVETLDADSVKATLELLEQRL